MGLSFQPSSRCAAEALRPALCVFQPGQRWVSDCQACVCDATSMSVQCTPIQCEAQGPAPQCDQDGFVIVSRPQANNPCCPEMLCGKQRKWGKKRQPVLLDQGAGHSASDFYLSMRPGDLGATGDRVHQPSRKNALETGSSRSGGGGGRSQASGQHSDRPHISAVCNVTTCRQALSTCPPDQELVQEEGHCCPTFHCSERGGLGGVGWAR